MLLKTEGGLQPGHRPQKQSQVFRFDRSWDAKPLKYTPLFPGTISCLAVIMGETGCSGHGLGLHGSRVILLYPAIPERFSGEKL